MFDWFRVKSLIQAGLTRIPSMVMGNPNTEKLLDYHGSM
jgi:hypothetical protein